MPRIYKLSRTGLKLLYKIRHHKGHGIHSPFVYNLIRKVIEEKSPYYVYGDLKEYIYNNPEVYCRISKYNRLSFRLVNYFEAKQILEIGSGIGVNTLYLTAWAKDTECICIEPDKKKYDTARKLLKNRERKIKLINGKELPVLTKKMDCIFIDFNDYNNFTGNFTEYLLSISHENTFIAVKGIRTNKRCRLLWKSIANMEQRTAMLDLFNVGIIFFNKNLYRWDYQISF